MIPREEARLLILGMVALLTVNSYAHDDKSYDTGDWIPVTPSVSRASIEQHKRQTEAVDRVLSVDPPQGQRFFPNEEYEKQKNRQRPQNQQFFAENVYSKIQENASPRKLKYQPEYNFENLPPSSENVNFYNQDALKQYRKVEQPPPKRTEKNYYNENKFVSQQQPSSSAAQNYYVSNKQIVNQRLVLPQTNDFLNVPNLNPQVPAVNAPNIYEQFNIPFNRSFYESLNPTFINNDFYAAVNNTPPGISSIPVHTKQDVELVYVPVENLKSNQANLPTQRTFLSQTSEKNGENSFNVGRTKQQRLLYNPNLLSSNEQLSSQSIYGSLNSQAEPEIPFYSQVLPEEQRLAGIRQDYLQQTLQATKLREQFKDETPLEIITTTTPKPDKKRKPHQPPLAVYLSESQADVSEVLYLLKNAKSISVQDTVSPNSPRIFVGPSNLNSPNGYSKFPLPYLNNVNGKRVNPKIEHLPFFVAPLNYKAPLGYSKIPLPSPHVGSVVVSTAQQTATTTEEALPINQEQYRTPEVTYQNTNPSTRFNLGYQSTPTSYFDEQSTNPPARSTIQSTVSGYNQPTRGLTFKDESKVPELSNINPLELAINEFELDQINNKFQEPNRKLVQHALSKPDKARSPTKIDQTTAAPVRSRTRTEYENRSPTEAPQSRRRGRPRQNVRISTSTTTSEPETERYTILEEFDSRKANNLQVTESYQEAVLADTGRRSSTPSVHAKYSNIENINDYIRTDPPSTNPSTDVSTSQFAQYHLENIDDYRRPLDTTTQKKPITSLYEHEDFLRNTQGQQFVTSDGIKYSVPNFEPETTKPETYFASQFDYSTPSGSLTTEQPYDNNEQQFTKEISAFNNNQIKQDEYTFLDNNREDLKTIYRTQSELNTLQPNTVLGEQFESQTRKEQSQQSSTYKQITQSEEFDNVFSPLEETAVRSLLQPSLLAPSSKQPEASFSPNAYLTTKQSSPATKEPSSTIRTRGRTRGRQPTTTTSAPRRAVGRRRPTRPTTDRVDSESYSKEEFDSTKSTTRQRFRTRGRPTQTTASERISTTESELTSFREPEIKYEPTVGEEPQSFMHFDAQFVNKPQIVSNEENVKEYHQLYSNSPTGSTEKQFTFEYENTSPIRATPIVDSQAAEPERDIQKVIQSEIIDDNENLIKYQSTARSEPRQRNDETTKKPTIRGRTRGRSRFTTTTDRTVSNPSYRTTASSVGNEDVKFIGEIRPKYSLRKSTTATPEVETKSPRSRTRSRVRLPGRTKTSPRPSDNEVKGLDGAEEITRRSSVVRTRNRGASHYQPSQNNKRDSDENDDLAEQNYPKDFLQKLESASKPTTRVFQTSKPLKEENDDDQSLHESINRPKILPIPEGLIGFSKQNYLPDSDKPHKMKVVPEDKSLDNYQHVESETAHSIVSDTSEEIFRELTEVEEIVLSNLEKTKQNESHEIDSAAEVTDSPTTQLPTTMTTTSVKSKGRKRGVWKVIRHKVVDPLETAESQNYQSVLNAFESIEKIEPHNKKLGAIEKTTEILKEITTSTAPTTSAVGVEKSESSTSNSSNESIFDSIYEMFGVFKNDKPKTSTGEPVIVPTTTFPLDSTEEMSLVSTEVNFSQETTFQVSNESKADLEENVTEPIFTTKAAEVTSKKNFFEVEPWEMKAVKTSTSTEVSHETEICYKGRCVKAKNKKKAIQ